jgi:hypothetical protein
VITEVSSRRNIVGKVSPVSEHGRPRNPGEIKEKAAVVGIAERGGDVRMFKMERVTIGTVGRAIEANVDLMARLMTDEAAIYRELGEDFGGGHFAVKHSARQYAKPGTDIQRVLAFEARHLRHIPQRVEEAPRQLPQ